MNALESWGKFVFQVFAWGSPIINSEEKASHSEIPILSVLEH